MFFWTSLRIILHLRWFIVAFTYKKKKPYISHLSKYLTCLKCKVGMSTFLFFSSIFHNSFLFVIFGVLRCAHSQLRAYYSYNVKYSVRNFFNIRTFIDTKTILKVVIIKKNNKNGHRYRNNCKKNKTKMIIILFTIMII